MQLVKNKPAMQDTQVQTLGQEDSLEKEMGSHFNIHAWKITRIEQLSVLQSMGSQESDVSKQIKQPSSYQVEGFQEGNSVQHLKKKTREG